MIIDNSQGNIEVIGDIKEFKTSIDPKNLEFITTLLSSNLYSDPEQSFIREIVSNAWDSHVEAGNTDTPVIIKITGDFSNKSITIRDYGTGLSPERFKEVYCNIGSSTKRDSNDFIGGFGIGKYSSLACSNTVYITSYYEGVAYYYVMVKSGNSITTNLFQELPTTEANGVEVTIRNIVSIRPYVDALDYIVFFPNIYIDGCDHYINNTKIKKFKNFATSTRPIRHKILLGNVLYPCNSSLMPPDIQTFLSDLSNTGIVIKFDIGELSITPNRENIIYNNDSIEIIAQRFRDAKEELLDLAKVHIEKDHDDIYEYYKIIHKTVYYNPLGDNINSCYDGLIIRHKDLEKMSITYKRHNLSGEESNLIIALSTSLPNCKGVVYQDKIHTNKYIYAIRTWNYTRAKKILICKNTPRLTATIKEYLKINYPNYAIIGDFSKDILKNHFKDSLYDFSSWSKKDIIVDGIYDRITKLAEVVDFTTDADFLAYKDYIAADKKSEVKKIKDVILYKYHPEFVTRHSMHFADLEEAIKYLKNLKRGIILANMDEDDSFWHDVAKAKDLILFKARKKVVEEIRKLNLSFVVDMGWLLREDPLINKVYTVVKYFPNGISTNFSELRYSVNPKTCDDCAKLLEYISVPYRYMKHCEVNGVIDPHTEFLCKELQKYLNAWNEAKNIVATSQYVAPDKILIATVIMKTKAYRINSHAYSDIKNNKLLKILCKK